ncbi:MAG: BatD family protein [Planctomycetota bacterium]|nr:BatD family protein [Planctomycetota bacterium]
MKLWTLLTLVATPLVAQTRDDEPLEVRAQIPTRIYYVGDSIELRVGVVADRLRPAVETPRVDNAEVAPIPIGNDFRALASSGVGDALDERNLYVSRFRIVPRRAGTLVVPSLQARAGNRSGRSKPLRLAIRDVPSQGRTDAFLGGVGRFETTSDVEPKTPRVGQEFIYSVRLTGPGSRGAFASPLLAIDRLAKQGVRAEPATVEAVFDPPSRVFQFRMRPTRALEVDLPPLAIAAFDPTSGRYLTKTAPSVHLRVVDIEPFDPSTLDYNPPVTRNSGANSTPLILAAAFVGLAAMFVTLRILLRHRNDPARRARRILLVARSQIGRAREPQALAAILVDALTAWFELAAGRPPGALTPDDAAQWLQQANLPADVVADTARLVSLCDRARFSGHRGDIDELAKLGRELCAALANTTGFKPKSTATDDSRSANDA